jgi:hypothetical protein
MCDLVSHNRLRTETHRMHGCSCFGCRNAGTDCRVFLQLTGDACVGPPVELREPGIQQGAAAAAPFQRGGVDSFLLQLPVLGPLRMAAVWMEGRTSPWHLDLVVVTGPAGELCALISS